MKRVIKRKGCESDMWENYDKFCASVAQEIRNLFEWRQREFGVAQEHDLIIDGKIFSGFF